MRHKNYFLTLLFALIAFAASAQTCPGPANRTALINLQRANTTFPAFPVVGSDRAGQVPYTDTCGNLRYGYYVRVLDSCINFNPILTVGNLPVSSFVYQCGTEDSLFYVDYKGDAVLVSVGGGLSTNWYNTNDTTTDLLRTASVLRSAWWRTVDSLGLLRWSNRPDGLNGPQFTLFQDSVVMDSDTIVWSSSYNQPLQYHDLTADGTYFYADSTKIVGIGQFPAFPFPNFDGTEKGFYYIPSILGVVIINGDGISGAVSNILIDQSQIQDNVQFDASSDDYVQLTREAGANIAYYDYEIQSDDSNYGRMLTRFVSSIDASLFAVLQELKDTNVQATMYLGAATSSAYYIGNRAFGVRTGETEAFPFDWIQTYLPNDTTENAVSFYNRAYYWKNEHPTGAAGDTLFHFWAATGPGGEAGQDPGFMTLDQVCAHCAADAVNWYNSDGTTTDNTRIATVTETATWLSDDVTVDGVFPFRFELSGEEANEPEMMVWRFPAPNNDSLTLAQSDQEIFFRSTNSLLLRADESASIWADSFTFYNNGLPAFRIGQYDVATIGGRKEAYEFVTITGTAQTELTLDGSSAVWVVPSNSNTNFEIHISAICSVAGNGVGISAGDAWNSWHLGGIKRIANTTSIVGSVQTDATTQADASMADAVVTIDADDTDESLRIRFTPPSTAGTTTVIKVVATLELTQTSY